MTNLDKSHYKDLKRFFYNLRDLHNQNSNCKTTIINNEPVTSCVLTVSYENDVGYIINNEKSKEIIEELIEDDFITPIDDNDSDTKKYLINNFDYLLTNLADLLRELKYD